MKASRLIEPLLLLAGSAATFFLFFHFVMRRGHFWPLELLLELAVGWAPSLGRVVQEAGVSGAGVLAALACLALLAAALQLSLGRLYRHRAEPEGPPRRWRKRWTAAILAGVLLLFVAGLAAAGAARQAVALFGSGEPIYKRKPDFL